MRGVVAARILDGRPASRSVFGSRRLIVVGFVSLALLVAFSSCGCGAKEPARAPQRDEAHRAALGVEFGSLTAETSQIGVSTPRGTIQLSIVAIRDLTNRYSKLSPRTPGQEISLDALRKELARLGAAGAAAEARERWVEAATPLAQGRSEAQVLDESVRRELAASAPGLAALDERLRAAERAYQVAEAEARSAFAAMPAPAGR